MQKHVFHLQYMIPISIKWCLNQLHGEDAVRAAGLPVELSVCDASLLLPWRNIPGEQKSKA